MAGLVAVGLKRRRAMVAAGLTLASAGAAGAIGADAPAARAAGGAGLAPATNPLLAQARLQGTFALTGQVTSAVRVRGEHRGQRVTRTWAFTPSCPTGPCSQLILSRRRSGKLETVRVRRRGSGLYVGSSTFYAPLRCGGRTYARGEAVPFDITVRVSAAKLTSGVLYATRINATYVNRFRRNLTPCVEVPGHDAASYHGQLVAL